jgi:hypothetical protein
MFKFSRILIVYIVAVPLALILGYLVSSLDTAPDSLFNHSNTYTFFAIGLLLVVLALPLLLKWHHFLLIVFWNSVFFAPFLPGQPNFWLVFAALSFSISVLNHIMFQKRFLHAPEFTRALLFMVAVVVCTAWFRGGIGFHSLGGAAYGGKKYALILGAAMGYFALTAEQVPILKSGKMAGLFFISGLTSAISNLIYYMGPAAFFIYWVVPSGFALDQALSDYGMTTIDRLSGLGAASIAALCFLLVRYGIRGLFDLVKPWRMAFLCLTVVGSCYAGYRSAFMLLVLVFAFQFYYEGLLRTHFLPIIVGLAVCGIVPIVLFADKMPAPVQRTLSFLPINVNSDILENAKGSTDWRVQMWAVVIKDIPKYLILGKGYAIDPSELAASLEESRTGMDLGGFEASLVAGDYHSGPLSLIISFGIFGVIGFLWVLYAGYRVLYCNLRFGDAKLRRINCVLLSLFLGNAVSYFFIFGAFDSQLDVFLGAVGLSVSLNGGVRRRAASKRKPVPVPQTLAMEPG